MVSNASSVQSRRTTSRPCGSPSPRPPFASWPTSTSSATANAASSSRAASASSGTATWQVSARRCCRTRSRRCRPAPSPGCDMCWAATSRRWCTRAAAYARQKDRLQTWAVTASIGPGSTNMLTGAALATINRLPVLLLPVRHVRHPGQRAGAAGPRTAARRRVTVNDAFKPLSRFFDRVWRPEQLPAALLGAMRVLTDPVETGAATIAIAAGRAGRSVRLAGIAVRRTHLARRPPAAGAVGDRAGRRDHRVARSAR